MKVVYMEWSCMLCMIAASIYAFCQNMGNANYFLSLSIMLYLLVTHPGRAVDK